MTETGSTPINKAFNASADQSPVVNVTTTITRPTPMAAATSRTSRVRTVAL
ncbi:MAG: hypothetical protein IPL59_16735 [Candidatus Competibacteraceae bacterium]|nr:hypothetical protein [Candidatus Competibacteraceae bacterium]